MTAPPHVAPEARASEAGVPGTSRHGPVGGDLNGGVGFNARLDRALTATGSLLCVGLDPHPGRFEGAVADFCRRVIDATAGAAVAFKPNSAFFEAVGTDGLAALAAVIAHVPDDRIVILDAKRGDIGSTAEAYARAAFDVLGADALTVNPYLGGDAVAPFLSRPERGAFVLCHTSNPGAQDLQTLEVAGGPLYLAVARAAARWNTRDNVGLVVGATYPDALAAVRAVAPDLPFLVPGIGAQGGDLGAALAAGLDARTRGMVINSSREIIFAADPGAVARRLRDAINDARTRRVL
jgi:orotidine 5'-phosphate decarboxylase subfamily 2